MSRESAASWSNMLPSDCRYPLNHVSILLYFIFTVLMRTMASCSHMECFPNEQQTPWVSDQRRAKLHLNSGRDHGRRKEDGVRSQGDSRKGGAGRQWQKSNFSHELKTNAECILNMLSFPIGFFFFFYKSHYSYYTFVTSCSCLEFLFQKAFRTLTFLAWPDFFLKSSHDWNRKVCLFVLASIFPQLPWEAGEMPQWVKPFLDKHECLTWNPQNPQKGQAMQHVCL